MTLSKPFSTVAKLICQLMAINLSQSESLVTMHTIRAQGRICTYSFSTTAPIQDIRNIRNVQ